MKKEERLILSCQGKTKYRIVVAKNAIPSEIHAAEELKHFLGEITDADFPIYFDDELKESETEILVGESVHVSALDCGVDLQALGQEGFTIKTVGKRLIIVGGRPRGTLYGVYTFLEKYLGCRWFTPKVTRIPKRCRVELPYIENDTQIPVLEYRDPFCAPNMDPDWHVRNKSNSSHVEMSDIHGNKMEYFPFVHTFDQLVPVAEYYDSHPEYFAMVNGKRQKDHTQLCLTNPDVLQISIARVKRWLKEHPKAKIISVSQNDCVAPCECENCRAVDEREGSHAGTLIEFVNKIAEAIEPDYPDVIIDTLAYQYTRKAPKYIRPRKNVAVRLCSIECCFSHPLSECDHLGSSFSGASWAEKSFAGDLRNWAKICDRLYIWDYTTNFAHYLSPFPDFGVIRSNIRFFIDNNVTGLFEEGNNCSRDGGRSGEFNELRQYVEAKLMWNPDLDTDTIVNEFLTGVYGMAAGPMREYYDLMQKQVSGKDIHMGIYDPPNAVYLGDEFVQKADLIFDRAEQLADNEDILNEVRVARLSIRYLKLTRIPMDNPDRITLIETFAHDLRDFGFTEIREGMPLGRSIDMLLRGDLFAPVSD